jgi:hypothetical protein
MLLVLGMHRSGTSVTARLLECLGAVHSKNLHPPLPSNPKGFFEDLDIERFNEFKFLPRIGIHWHSIGFVDWTNLSAADRSKFALEALEIVRSNFSSVNSLSVLKEPRIGILLPFWLSVLHHAGYNVKVVCALRDPASVARSLTARDGFSTTHGGMLYITNWLSILPYIQDLPVAFVQFDEIFADPARVLRTVADKLAIPLPTDFESRLHGFSSSFFDSSLRHSSLDRRDLPLEADLPPLAVELYDSLLSAAQAQNIKKTAKFLSVAEKIVNPLKPVFSAFDKVFVEVAGSRHAAMVSQSECQQLQNALRAAEAAPSEARLLLEKEAMMRGQLAERLTALEAEKVKLSVDLDGSRQRNVELETQVSALDAARAAGISVQLAATLTERDGRIAGLEGAVSERDGRIAGLEGAVSERDGRIAGLEGAVSERDGRIVGLEGAVNERDGRIAGLEGAVNERDGRIAGLEEVVSDFESERSTLEARLSMISSEHSALVLERDELAAECDSLAGCVSSLEVNVQERFEELAKLAKMHIATADDRNALQSKFGALQAERDLLATERTSLEARLSTLSSEHSTLVAECDELAAVRAALTNRVTSLEADLQDRFEELALLGKRLLEVEAEGDSRVAAIQACMDSMASRFTWKLGAPARFIWDKTRNTVLKIYRLPTAWQILRMHRSSGLFNHEWYFRQNPDVKATTARPFLHFAFHGVFEGRSPNSSYNEAAYLRHTPSAQSSGLKPLLHYTLKGWKAK